jgi:hypothetical protein
MAREKAQNSERKSSEFCLTKNAEALSIRRAITFENVVS